MNNIDLSIIVPVYNVENYLRRGLDSILLQPSSITYEILLIDDGSSDKSGTICDEYQKKFPNVFVSHIENNGVAEARNLGHYQGEIIYILWIRMIFCQIISLKRYLLI